MNNLYYIVILIFFISSCSNETQINDENFSKKIDFKKLKDNKIFPRIFKDNESIDIELKSNIENGKYIGIFYDSTIAFTGEFKNNEPFGLFHYYDLNGKLTSTELYEKGRQEQQLYYYSENGKLAEIIGYKKNRLNGEYKIFHEDGTIKESGQFFEGYAIGTWKEFFKGGKIKSLKYYSDSIGYEERKKLKRYENTMGVKYLSFPIKTWLEYDSLGNIFYKTYHDDSFNIILEEEFYPSGKLHFKTSYNGEVPYMCSKNPGYSIRNGSAEQYYENGKIKIEGYYINEEKNGVWKYFDLKGNIIKTEKYRNDSLIKK
jgi:uncharacterized protein